MFFGILLRRGGGLFSITSRVSRIRCNLVALFTTAIADTSWTARSHASPPNIVDTTAWKVPGRSAGTFKGLFYSLTPIFVVAPEEVQKQFYIMSPAKMAKSLNVIWSDGHKSTTFDYFWMRDNCHCYLFHHPQTDERFLDTFSIPNDVSPKHVGHYKTILRAVRGARNVGSASDYDLRFLRAYCFSSRSQADHTYVGRMWKATDIGGESVPMVGYEVMTREDTFFQWLELICTYGFSSIADVPHEGDGYVGKVAQRIPFLRTTFWSDHNPKNLPLAGVELFPHTDFIWSDTPPGLHFLHCVEFKGGEGGDTFGKLRHSDDFVLKLKLREGYMLVFNNHRMLYGKYDAQTTVRHLKACYLDDLEQFQSKYSILNSSRANFLNAQQKKCQPSSLALKGLQQTRFYASAAAKDPGYDTDAFNRTFVREALKPHQPVIDSDECYADGSSLREVMKAGVVSYNELKHGTKAELVYQCALFKHDIEVNLLPRIIGMLRKLEGEHIRLATGAKVDLFEHSLQTATRALHDKADEEMVVVALLHDIGEMMSPVNHGKVAGAILEPYIAPEATWLLNHHEIFQGYYYFHHVGGDPNTRDIYKQNPNYQLTVDFCEKWDQASFDPHFDSLPVTHFEPMLKRVLSRKPYWHFPNHPKFGVANIQQVQ